MKKEGLTLAGQLSLLFVGTVILSQILIGIAFFQKTNSRLETVGELADVRDIASFYKSVANLKLGQRQETLDLGSSAEIIYTITNVPEATEPVSFPDLQSWFFDAMGDVPVNLKVIEYSPDNIWNFWFSDEWEACFQDIRDSSVWEKCPRKIYSIRLSEHQWLNASTDNEPSVFIILIPILVSAFITALGVSVVTIIAVRRITKPLRDLSDAADKLGRGEQGIALEEYGPRELSSLTHAFNTMQQRISRFVQDRTQMLAAISHDLRTPITSLRLRSEFIRDPELQEKIITTLEEMQSMVEASLAFARQEILVEEVVDVDITAILRELSTEGQNISFSCRHSQYIYPCQIVSFKRAIRNLLDNAVKYGKEAAIELKESQHGISIIIQDKGPGIPNDELENIFEPFVRLDPARNTESGSVGLGLSISRTIIHKLGGTILLKNLPIGLEVNVLLPKTPVSLT